MIICYVPKISIENKANFKNNLALRFLEGINTLSVIFIKQDIAINTLSETFIKQDIANACSIY